MNLSVGAGRVLLFFDYDTQWGADRSRLPGGPKAWGPLEFEHTDRILELTAEHGIRACFAVVGSAALPGSRPYHDPAQIRRIAEAGHEVASHSHRHEWLPGLSRRQLIETLAASKDALEQCIGAPVVSFVPPFNQPFDYPAGLSFSLSERRSARETRVDLADLCEALGDLGYLFCRVSYRGVPLRLLERALVRRIDRPSRIETIAGVSCARLNTPGGFGRESLEMARRCARGGGLAVAYGHPHSLSAANSQNELFLAPFLKAIAGFSARGLLRVRLPRELVAEEKEAA